MSAEVNELIKRTCENSIHNLNNSAIFAQIITKKLLNNPKNEPLCALQLGYAIILNKPIILIVEKSAELPDSMARTAKLIEWVNLDDKADMERVSVAVAEFAKSWAKEQ